MDFLAVGPKGPGGYIHWRRSTRTACGVPVSAVNERVLPEGEALKTVNCNRCLRVMRWEISKNFVDRRTTQ